MTKTVQEYSKMLTELDIENEIVEHPDLKTPPEVQQYLGLTLADGLSTMLMKVDGQFIAVVRRCDTRLDSKKLKKLLGTSKIRMANPDEFDKLTDGLPLGTARVLTPNLKTYLDEKLFEKEYLTSGSGSFTCSIRIKSDDLGLIPNSEIASFSD